MKWVAIAIAAPVALVAVTAVIGLLLPARHEVARSARIRGVPAQVYAIVRDVARGPEWRSGLTRVELLESRQGRARFREIGRDGTILYEIEEEEPPRRLVTRIADESLPFGGSWTYELSPSGDGTDVRITERGEVRNPIFRTLSKLVFGHTATLDRYLADLRRKQGGLEPGPTR